MGAFVVASSTPLPLKVQLQSPPTPMPPSHLKCETGRCSADESAAAVSVSSVAGLSGTVMNATLRRKLTPNGIRLLIPNKKHRRIVFTRMVQPSYKDIPLQQEQKNQLELSLSQSQQQQQQQHQLQQKFQTVDIAVAAEEDASRLSHAYKNINAKADRSCIASTAYTSTFNATSTAANDKKAKTAIFDRPPLDIDQLKPLKISPRDFFLLCEAGGGVKTWNKESIRILADKWTGCWGRVEQEIEKSFLREGYQNNPPQYPPLDINPADYDLHAGHHYQQDTLYSDVKNDIHIQIPELSSGTTPMTYDYKRSTAATPTSHDYKNSSDSTPAIPLDYKSTSGSTPTPLDYKITPITSPLPSIFPSSLRKSPSKSMIPTLHSHLPPPSPTHPQPLLPHPPGSSTASIRAKAAMKPRRVLHGSFEGTPSSALNHQQFEIVTGGSNASTTRKSTLKGGEGSGRGGNKKHPTLQPIMHHNRGHMHISDVATAAAAVTEAVSTRYNTHIHTANITKRQTGVETGFESALLTSSSRTSSFSSGVPFAPYVAQRTLPPLSHDGVFSGGIPHHQSTYPYPTTNPSSFRRPPSSSSSSSLLSTMSSTCARSSVSGMLFNKTEVLGSLGFLGPDRENEGWKVKMEKLQRQRAYAEQVRQAASTMALGRRTVRSSVNGGEEGSSCVGGGGGGMSPALSRSRSISRQVSHILPSLKRPSDSVDIAVQKRDKMKQYAANIKKPAVKAPTHQPLNSTLRKLPPIGFCADRPNIKELQEEHERDVRLVEKMKKELGFL